MYGISKCVFLYGMEISIPVKSFITLATSVCFLLSVASHGRRGKYIYYIAIYIVIISWAF